MMQLCKHGHDLAVVGTYRSADGYRKCKECVRTRMRQRYRDKVGRPLRSDRKEETRYIVEDRGYITPCHVWTMALSPDGYGDRTVNGRHVHAHVYAWEQVNGPVPEGKELHHLCEVRPCINVDHLQPLTRAEHMIAHGIHEKAHRANREKTHCKHGHEFTEANTWVSKLGHRHCKACARERMWRRNHQVKGGPG